MNDFAGLQSNVKTRINSRSMGLKLIVVCGLALLMTIPALFVSGLVEERTQRAGEVTNEISGLVGGQQTFLGPTLVIPYDVPPQIVKGATVVNAAPDHGVYVVFPVQAGTTVNTRTEERHRSLFKVPVFQAELNFDATFDLTGVPASAPTGALLDWPRAEIVVGVSDARGALDDGTLTVDGKTATFVPSENLGQITLESNSNQRLPLILFGVKTPSIQPNAKFHATAALHFSGAKRIAVLAYGKTTHLSVEGDWPNPSFDGSFLPVKRTISKQGFNGEWSVPFIARGVRAEGRGDSLDGLFVPVLLCL